MGGNLLKSGASVVMRRKDGELRAHAPCENPKAIRFRIRNINPNPTSMRLRVFGSGVATGVAISDTFVNSG